MIYPDNFESRIGFDTIRTELLKRCISAMGVAQCEAMHFSTDYDLVVEWLEQTHEFMGILQSKREFPLNYYFDMRGVLKSISAPGTFMSAHDLFDLQRSLTTCNEIMRFFSRNTAEQPPYPRLKRLASVMQPFPDLVSEISRVLDKNGQVKDNASPQLAELRHTVARLQSSISGILRRIIAHNKQEGYLDNDVQASVRDGRLVIPVAPAHKRKIRGIVHDESASGKTVFIEPDEIVEANNHIRETEAEIAREIIRILTEVTDQIRPHTDALLDTYDTLGRLDFIRAKALFALDIDAQMPHVEPTPVVEWYHAIHPALLLSLQAQGKQVVPLNIELNDRQRIVLISGPNAGGKSVCLKTVGVVQYMMQCGVIPALHDNSHMGMFKSICIDIGDQQSIEDDLSTYSSHLQNMKRFLTVGDKNTLILIDEFGSGTEPQIGGAIAQAILEQLNARRVMGVITTHYQNLKHFAEESEGIVNGAMLYDRQRMQPLFQLSVGYPGSSFAIEIARKIGLPQGVIDKASEIVGSDYINMDKYLLDIVRDRKYWENKRYEIHQKEKRLDALLSNYSERVDKIDQDHREIIKQAKTEALGIIRESNAKIEQAIREIKEYNAEKERTKAARQQLEEFKRRLQENPEQPSEAVKALQPKHKPKAKPRKTSSNDKGPIMAGDFVTMKGSTTVGEVITADEKYCTVAFGNIKTRIEVDKLEKTSRASQRKARTEPSLSRSTTDEIRSRQLQFKPDIDVRGMRADEAIQAVTYFIDDAIQFSIQRVRILHGTGAGILRELIRQYLNTVPGVKSFRDEHVQFGGAGITVVELE